MSSNSRLFLYNCDTKATSTDTTYRSEQNNYHLKPLVQGLLPLISSHCHWLAPSSTTMNTHLQVACWEIQAAIHRYLNFFLFVLGTYGSHSIHWKKIMWFLPPILQIFQQDKSNGNHIKFYIMDLGATLLAETEILPFWRYDLKVFWDPELSKIWLLSFHAGFIKCPLPKRSTRVISICEKLGIFLQFSTQNPCGEGQ